MEKHIYMEKLTKAARLRGLHIASAAPLFLPIRHYEALGQYQSQGFNGELSYLGHDPALYCAATRLLPEARSVVSFAVFYDRADDGGEPPPGHGRVARYAWGRDYHKVLKKLLNALVKDLAAELGTEISYKICSDSIPLLERAYAHEAGLGFVGKNTMLIRTRGGGSFFFLAEIIWDLVIESSPLTIVSPSAPNCGSCSNCLDSCPTGAFVSEYHLDARRCISYLSIEKRGMLSWWEREALGEWIFGCDKCQDVCPFNHQALKNEALPDVQEFSKAQGVGPHLELKRVFECDTHEKFTAHFAGTPLMRAKREGLIRNGVCVAVNRGFDFLLPAIQELSRSDASEVVRAHSWWALCKREGPKGIEAGLKDPSILVQSEVRALLDNFG